MKNLASSGDWVQHVRVSFTAGHASRLLRGNVVSQVNQRCLFHRMGQRPL